VVLLVGDGGVVTEGACACSSTCRARRAAGVCYWGLAPGRLGRATTPGAAPPTRPRAIVSVGRNASRSGHHRV